MQHVQLSYRLDLIMSPCLERHMLSHILIIKLYSANFRFPRCQWLPSQSSAAHWVCKQHSQWVLNLGIHQQMNEMQQVKCRACKVDVASHRYAQTNKHASSKGPSILGSGVLLGNRIGCTGRTGLWCPQSSHCLLRATPYFLPFIGVESKLHAQHLLPVLIVAGGLWVGTGQPECQDEEEEEDFTCFGQPTGLMACATVWQ